MFPRTYEDTKHAESPGLVWKGCGSASAHRKKRRVGDYIDAEGTATRRVLCRTSYEGAATRRVLWKECGERRLGDSWYEMNRRVAVYVGWRHDESAGLSEFSRRVFHWEGTASPRIREEDSFKKSSWYAYIKGRMFEEVCWRINLGKSLEAIGPVYATTPFAEGTWKQLQRQVGLHQPTAAGMVMSILLLIALDGRSFAPVSYELNHDNDSPTSIYNGLRNGKTINITTICRRCASPRTAGQKLHH